MKIIVRLFGGIGNQFFQYAVGRALATKHKGELLLDDSLLQRHRRGVTYRNYELDVYNINAQKLLKKERLILQFRVWRPFRYLYATGILKSSFIYYREPHYEFDPKIHQLNGNLIAEGHWQSERYFADIADKLRHELQPIAPPPNNVRRLLDQIANENSVSLHVRRHDYLSCPKASANFFVCNLEYYSRAVSVIAERTMNPVFYIFSDDPGWVAKEFQIDFPMVLASRPQSWRAYEDLRMMSHCTHHIIANSSFSWWGAWLNPSPNKIVVAPSRWFRVEKNTKDLIPPEWNMI